MALNLGTTAINRMYLNNGNIKKAYHGVDLVFDNTALENGLWGNISFSGLGLVWEADATAIGSDNLATIFNINNVKLDDVTLNTVVLTFDTAGDATYFHTEVDTFLFGTNVMNISNSTLSSTTVTFTDATEVTDATAYVSGLAGANINGTWTVPSGATVLQDISWNMTSNDTAIITSSGLEIIDSLKTSQLNIGPGPRFWNGTEANNYGATNKAFSTNPLCDAWWKDNYHARIRQNGRDWITMQVGGNIWTACQTTYNNIGETSGAWDTNGVWMDQALGQFIEIELYAKGNVPDNWYTYEEGVSLLDGMTQTEHTLVFDITEYPDTSNITSTFFASGAPYSSSPYDRFIKGQFVGGNQAAVDACSDYIGVYVTPAAVTGSFGHPQTAGWYVFGNKRLDNSRPTWDVIAWPTGGASGDGSQACMSTVEGSVPWVALSDYTGATGNGGTDGWSPPYGSLLDWDTVVGLVGHYAGNQVGIAQDVNIDYNATTGVLDAYAQTGGDSIEPTQVGYSSTTEISIDMTLAINSTTFSAGLPFCAYWNSTHGSWRKGTAVDRGQSKLDMVYDIGTMTFNEGDDFPAAVLLFDSDPGDVSGWRAYDGPTS